MPVFRRPANELLATGYNTFYFLVTVSKGSVLREAD